MSVEFEVIAQPRTAVGKGASRRLRRAGLVPAIVYGAERDPEMITLVHSEMLKHLEHNAFYSHVLDLKVGEVITQVVLKDLQRHPAKPFILHADFMRVSADHKLRKVVPIRFLNEERCKGIKMGGQASHTITEVEIVCLPKDLPEYIGIDMSDLDAGDVIHLSQLPLPEGVMLAHAPDPDEPVVVIHGARADEGDAESES